MIITALLISLGVPLWILSLRFWINSSKIAAATAKFPVNLNQYIWVKLNKKGVEIYNRYWQKTVLIEPPALKLNQDGFAKFQIWEFMKLFGPELHTGFAEPFEMNAFIEPWE